LVAKVSIVAQLAGSLRDEVLFLAVVIQQLRVQDSGLMEDDS
jgi:hypothetical protein